MQFQNLFRREPVKSWQCLSFRRVGRKDRVWITLPPAFFFLSWEVLATLNSYRRNSPMFWVGETHTQIYSVICLYSWRYFYLSVGPLLGPVYCQGRTVPAPPRQFRATPAATGIRPVFTRGACPFKPWLVMAEKSVWKHILKPGLNRFTFFYYSYFISVSFWICWKDSGFQGVVAFPYSWCRQQASAHWPVCAVGHWRGPRAQPAAGLASCPTSATSASGLL